MRPRQHYCEAQGQGQAFSLSRFSHRPGAGNGRERHDAQHEPRKIKTLAVKGDAAENGGIPAAPQSRPRISDRFGQPSSSDQLASVTQRVVLYDEERRSFEGGFEGP